MTSKTSSRFVQAAVTAGTAMFNSRVYMIVTSELSNAAHVVSRGMFGQARIPSWTWVTLGDDLVCPECEDLSGQEFRGFVEFEPAHPNCRCEPAPNVEDKE